MQRFVKYSCTVLFVLLMATRAFAADNERRFPTDHITLEQWQTYLNELRALPDVSIRESPQQITITQQKPSIVIFAFTTPNNPAHPGIVVRRLIASSEGYSINRAGYYAGSVEAFTRWWHAFDQLDEKIKADMRASKP